jgi:hypothetical protein
VTNTDEPICFGFIGKRVVDETEADLLTLLGQLVASAGWHLYAKPNGMANMAVVDGYRSVSSIRPVQSADPFTADPLVVFYDDELGTQLQRRHPGWRSIEHVVAFQTIEKLSKLVTATQLYTNGVLAKAGAGGTGG